MFHAVKHITHKERQEGRSGDSQHKKKKVKLIVNFILEEEKYNCYLTIHSYNLLHYHVQFVSLK